MAEYKLFGGFMRPKRDDDDDDDNDGCGSCVAKPIQSTRITYDGPNLPCSGIHTCDSITVAIQKLDNLLCELISCCNSQPTTTSTTSTSSTSSSTTTFVNIPAFRLIWDDINNAPVADPSSLSDWNTFFDFPSHGDPFTSIVVVGNEVRLSGGDNIDLKDSKFDILSI